MNHEGIKSTKQFSRTLAVFKTVRVEEASPSPAPPESYR